MSWAELRLVLHDAIAPSHQQALAQQLQSRQHRGVYFIRLFCFTFPNYVHVPLIRQLLRCVDPHRHSQRYCAAIASSCPRAAERQVSLVLLERYCKGAVHEMLPLSCPIRVQHWMFDL